MPEGLVQLSAPPSARQVTSSDEAHKEARKRRWLESLSGTAALIDIDAGMGLAIESSSSTGGGRQFMLNE